MVAYRVLIVDDQREVSRLLRSALEALEQEMEIRDVLSGEEAMLEIAAWHPDLLVSDIRLPGISGFDLMRRTKIRNEETRIILISGITDPQIRRQVAEAGADAFFYKPVEMADFLDAVERSLGLVKTILASEMEVEKQSILQERREKIQQSAELADPVQPVTNNETPNLNDILETYCQELEAASILITDLEGNSIAQGGKGFDTGSLAIWEEASHINRSGITLKGKLKADETNIIYRQEGKSTDLTISVITDEYNLLILHPHSNKIEPATLGKIQVLAQVCTHEIRVALPSIVIAKPSLSRKKILENVLINSPDDPELESLLKQQNNAVKPADLEAFWSDSCSEDNSIWHQKNDIIPYQQAQEMGLLSNPDATE